MRNFIEGLKELAIGLAVLENDTGRLHLWASPQNKPKKHFQTIQKLVSLKLDCYLGKFFTRQKAKDCKISCNWANPQC